MKPDHYQRNHALAAEYVLGTLRGGARRRFETWMLESPRVRRQVWYWERRFQSLNRGIVERQPPAVVWRRIHARIGRRRPAARAWWWPVGSMLAASLVLALVLLWPSAPVSQQYVGVVQNSQAEPLWVLRTVPDTGHRRLSLKGVNVAAVDGKDFELWLLPRSGAAISVGLLPAGGGQRSTSLSARQLEVLRRSRALAVSREPAGGSPTGQPTGPVLYQVRMITL